MLEHHTNRGDNKKGAQPGVVFFDRFTLKKLLGRGGMGIVWLAYDQKLELEVALKFLPEIMTQDNSAINELKSETRRSLDLTHPHIVRIFDFIQNDETAAISMELVDGPTISKLRVQMDNRIFEVREIESWIRQFCSALDYAHYEAKIAHRDLKPGNLMVNGKSNIKVADFGISRSMSDSISRVTQLESASGTLNYMSPQQAQGTMPMASDDIYSLGATIYELLTSRPPFYTGEILAQLAYKVPPSLDERRKELGIAGDTIPAHWEETVAACLSKEPSERPSSAGEVAERLRLTSEGTMNELPPEVLLPRAYKAVQKSYASLWISGIIAALLLFAGIGWYYGVYLSEEEVELVPRESAYEKLLQLENANQDRLQKFDKFKKLQTSFLEMQEERKTQNALFAEKRKQFEEQLALAQNPEQLEKLMTEVAALEAKEREAQLAFEERQKAQAAEIAMAKKASEEAEAKMKDLMAEKNASTPPPTTTSGQNFVSSIGLEMVAVEGLGGTFWVGKTEVTQKQYQEVMGSNPSKRSEGGAYPVDSVDFNDIQSFCDRLTQLDRQRGKIPAGSNYQIPSPQQWEYFVGNADLSDAVISSSSSKLEKSSPVASKKANQFGLHDVRGNVWEWTSDQKLRGGSFSNFNRSGLGGNPLALKKKLRPSSQGKMDNAGFRVVVVK